MRKIAAACFFLVLAACSGGEGDSRETVDLVAFGGDVRILDADYSRASTLVVNNGLVVAAGDESLRQRYAGRQEIDLAGRSLLPGFNDSHTHIRGRPKRFVDLTETTSIEQLKTQVAAKADELGAGEWISGYGWSEDAMDEQRRPLRADLDAAAPDNPVLLDRAGGHSAVANSVALRLAEVDRNTPDPDRGVIERDADGELNGIIRERQDIVSRLIPEPSDADVRDDLVHQLERQLSFGITSLTQAMDDIEHFAEWEAVYEQHRGELPRANVQVFWEGPEAMTAFGKKSGDGDEFLRVGPIKIFVDGGFTGPAAYTREPYKGESEFRGKLNMTPDELRTLIRESHAAGWQLGIHAIGDAAIELVVDELELALLDTPRDDHRHYLNHFTVMPPTATMEKMALNNIAITQQPNFTYTLAGRYSAYLDGARLEHNNSLRSPMNHGIHVAISSDILPIGPMVGLMAAVNRTGMDGVVYGEVEALSLDEALRAYTWGGAWLSFEESLKGTLQAGQAADFVILDRNIGKVSAEELPQVQVDQTWLAGMPVYERDR